MPELVGVSGRGGAQVRTFWSGLVFESKERMRFAAKRLTRSDLTLFETQFRRQNAGNQKSINLNRKVFVDLIFPGAPALAAGQAARFPVQLRVFGPGGNPNGQSLTRKVIAAGGSQKNWRLNGETIHDPNDEPGRYDDLQDGDFAILGFEGETVPDAIDLVLISQIEMADQAIHQTIKAMLGPGARAMAALSEAEVARLVATAPSSHPLGEILDPAVDEDLEEAVLGSAEAVRSLRRRSIRRQSADELALARRRAAEIGRSGEVLVAAFLRGREADGRIAGFTWNSEVNAIHPWDMTIHRSDGADRRIEIKSTTGPHDRMMHVSQAEFEAALEGSAPRTEIWRISELTGQGGVLRRSSDFRDLARAVHDFCQTFGTGLLPDGWSVSPSRLQWSEPRTISYDEDPDD